MILVMMDMFIKKKYDIIFLKKEWCNDPKGFEEKSERGFKEKLF